jgi:AraC family transcriptional regulator
MRRLELARKLLADPKNDVLEIAASVGYESSSHFARVFKRHLGVTPTEYRRQL